MLDSLSTDSRSPRAPSVQQAAHTSFRPLPLVLLLFSLRHPPSQYETDRRTGASRLELRAKFNGTREDRSLVSDPNQVRVSESGYGEAPGVVSSYHLLGAAAQPWASTTSSCPSRHRISLQLHNGYLFRGCPSPLGLTHLRHLRHLHHLHSPSHQASDTHVVRIFVTKYDGERFHALSTILFVAQRHNLPGTNIVPRVLDRFLPSPPQSKSYSRCLVRLGSSVYTSSHIRSSIVRMYGMSLRTHVCLSFLSQLSVNALVVSEFYSQ